MSNQTRSRFRVVALGDRHSLVYLNDRIAVIHKALKRPGKGGRRVAPVAGYFGFATVQEANRFAGSVQRRFPKARVAVREAQRLETAIEVKVGNIDTAIETLAQEVFERKELTPKAAADSIFPNRVVSFPIKKASAPSYFTDRSTAMVASRQRSETVQSGRYRLSIS